MCEKPKQRRVYTPLSPAKFSKFSEAKINDRAFGGPYTKELIEDSSFTNIFNHIDKQAWNTCIDVTENFLGNNRSADFHEEMKMMLECCYNNACNLSLELHYVHLHLSFFARIWIQ